MTHGMGCRRLTLFVVELLLPPPPFPHGAALVLRTAKARTRAVVNCILNDGRCCCWLIGLTQVRDRLYCLECFFGGLDCWAVLVSDEKGIYRREAGGS
jgi:hypothetical protein